MVMSMGQGGGSSFRPMSEINVTPFVDVMLVLLVIFMVTAPMMVQGLDVNLPSAPTKAIESNAQRLTLTVGKDKRVYMGDTEIKMDDLAKVLGSNEKVKKDKEIDLHADQSLPYGVIVEIMAIARAAGAESINMVTDPSGRPNKG